MTWKRPQDNYPCECGSVVKHARNPGHPLNYDEQLEEFYISFTQEGEEGRQIVYFCCFCGGKLPASKR